MGDTQGKQEILLENSGYDAFSRLRVSEPKSIFDSKLTRGIEETIFFDSSTANGGAVAFVANQTCVDLSITTTSGSQAIRQTREYFNYQPGKSSFVFITAVVGALKNNVRQRVGLFDANNGFFYEQDGVDKKFVIRSSTSGSPSDNAITQANWNLDTFDGKGPSRIKLDPSKNMILVLDFQYLGVGLVRFGFDVDGKVTYAHQVAHANTTSGVYMTSPNLPVRWEITATGTVGSATTLRAICCSVNVEGGYDPRGLMFAANNGNSAKSANAGVRVPMLSIRLKSAYNRVPVIPMHSDTISSGNQAYLLEYWLLKAGGTAALTGATWTGSYALSSANFDTGATSLTIGDAICVGNDYVNNAIKTSNITLGIMKLVSNIAGTSDIFCITAQGIGGNATNIYCAINWLEEI